MLSCVEYDEKDEVIIESLSLTLNLEWGGEGGGKSILEFFSALEANTSDVYDDVGDQGDDKRYVDNYFKMIEN